MYSYYIWIPYLFRVHVHFFEWIDSYQNISNVGLLEKNNQAKQTTVKEQDAFVNDFSIDSNVLDFVRTLHRSGQHWTSSVYFPGWLFLLCLLDL